MLKVYEDILIFTQGIFRDFNGSTKRRETCICTVNKRAVRIPLECILVFYQYCIPVPTFARFLLWIKVKANSHERN